METERIRRRERERERRERCRRTVGDANGICIRKFEYLEASSFTRFGLPNSPKGLRVMSHLNYR